MKILISMIITGMIAKSLILMPAQVLPQYPVRGTVKIQDFRAENALNEASRPSAMSRKMYYLKTGRNINNEINCNRQKNYWGKGVSTRVRFPSHLTECDEFQRQRITGSKTITVVLQK